VGLLIPQLSALWPLWTVTRIKVREAMSAYGVQAGTGRHRYAWGYRLRWVPQTTWLGVRGLFRKPGRATLTLLALTLSCAVFLAGRWLRPHEQGTIVINDTAAQQLGLQVGEHLSMQVDNQTPQAERRQVSWTIVGVVHDVDYLSGSTDPTGPLGEAFTTPETLNGVLHKPADYA